MSFVVRSDLTSLNDQLPHVRTGLSASISAIMRSRCSKPRRSSSCPRISRPLGASSSPRSSLLGLHFTPLLMRRTIRCRTDCLEDGVGWRRTASSFAGCSPATIVHASWTEQAISDGCSIGTGVRGRPRPRLGGLSPSSTLQWRPWPQCRSFTASLNSSKLLSVHAVCCAPSRRRSRSVQPDHIPDSRMRIRHRRRKKSGSTC